MSYLGDVPRVLVEVVGFLVLELVSTFSEYFPYHVGSFPRG